ncbi:MAG: hypothetical protein JWM19_922 [Actinomycetia bacterium]|nr:hypothetical protein [Actinomycetes bacterium]
MGARPGEHGTLAGKVWVGRVPQVAGRLIRIDSVSAGRVTYTVLAPSRFRYKSRNSGGMALASLRLSYRPASAEEQQRNAGQRVDLTCQDGCLAYAEVLTDAGIVRVNVGAAGPQAILVVVEPADGWGTEYERSWSGRVSISMKRNPR